MDIGAGFHRKAASFVSAAAVLVWGLAALPALGETITVTKRDCAMLVRHVAAPGVAYRPGVDVHGRAVAPADLPGTNTIAVPKIVNIPITIDLAKRFGIPITSDLFKAEAYAGTARVRVDDGRTWFNGKPLSSEEAHALAQLCQETAPLTRGRGR